MLTVLSLLQPRKAVPVLAPLPFVHANTSDISVVAHKVAAALSDDHALDYMGSSWPAVGMTDNPRVELLHAVIPMPVPENKVHDVIMRYFAKQFIPMNRDELSTLKMEDLETIM